jgi:hypothetical protein
VWIKTSPIDLSGTITLLKIGEKKSICETEFSTAFQDLGADLAARIEVTAEEWRGSPVVSVRLINQSSEKGGDKSVARELYEVSLEVGEIETTYFEIDPLPDSFRYDRRIAAYGENCGVISTQQGTFKSADATRVKRGRPQFWDIEQLGDEPDLTFARLSDDPMQPLHDLVASFRSWTEQHWSEGGLYDYAKQFEWSDEMHAAARETATRALAEVCKTRRRNRHSQEPRRPPPRV